MGVVLLSCIILNATTRVRATFSSSLLRTTNAKSTTVGCRNRLGGLLKFYSRVA